jgi:uncharacterized protein (TIGR02266 family)
VASLNPVRIRLRYPDLDSFIEKFAPNVTRGGVFLASRNVQPVGAEISFEIQIISGEVVLAGQGKVSWVKEFNPAEPNRPYGMGVQFLSVTLATKPILARILRAKDSGTGPRRTTGPLSPIGNAGGLGGRLGGSPGAMNGQAATPIDTSVDLVAEYGLDDAAVRRLVERTWMTGARTSDDLADLLRPEPVESVTLAQALADLPRLLDPQYTRRRTSGGFRSVDAHLSAATMPPPLTAAAETTHQSTSRDLGAGADASESTDMTGAGDAAESTDMTGIRGDAENTDMTGIRDTVQSMHAVQAEPDAVVTAPADNERSGKRRKRRR